jgi:hypothetical protein
VFANHDRRAVDVRPGHDFDREVDVVAHPQQDRFQEVHQIELTGGKSLD